MQVKSLFFFFKHTAHQLSWILLQFIAAPPAIITAAVRGLSLGLYYPVKTMKRLEPASSLFSPPDYSVSMDTWLQFPLQSANQRLKTGSRSIALLWCLYPSRAALCLLHCHPSCKDAQPVYSFRFLIFSFKGSFYVWLPFYQPAFAVAHDLCQRSSVARKGEGTQIKLSIWSFSSCRKLCFRHRRRRCFQWSTEGKANTSSAPLQS